MDGLQRPSGEVPGQTIDLGGLLCLVDKEGPCGNAVKDAQRTKTTPQTTRTLSVIWGSKALGDRTARTVGWYRSLLEDVGAHVEAIEITSESQARNNVGQTQTM